MDSAVEAGVMAERARNRSLSQAERDVRPVVGDIDVLAFDSADEIYRFALKEKGVETKGVNTAGLQALLKHCAKPTSVQARSFANDSAGGPSAFLTNALAKRG